MTGRKLRIISASYALAAVIVLAGYALAWRTAAESYKLQLKNNYRHAFYEVVAGVNDMDSSLKKSLYATSPSMVAGVCTDVFGKAMSAQIALGELPVDSREMEKTAAFITKVGDYAFMLSRSAAAGQQYTDEQLENLRSLARASSALAENINGLMERLDDGSLSMSELDSAGDVFSAPDIGSTLGDGIKDVESEFPEVPSLIYDGPFSDHVLHMTPALTEGLEEITAQEALYSASAQTGIPTGGMKVYSERDGNLPAYMISARTDGGTVYLEVTKRGGILLSLSDPRIISESSISAQEAAETAARFLEDAGFEHMRESYHMTENGRCIINFAYEQDGVICYTDLIKVAVALDDGGIVGFESLGYVMSHTEREFPEIQVTETEASERVPSGLEVISHEICVIPTDGKNEVFCHEFVCEDENGAHCVICVNAVTGAQEKILILIESESGTLAI